MKRIALLLIPILILAFINIVFWALKELLASRGILWLQQKWPTRVIAFLTFAPMVVAVTLIIVGESPIDNKPAVTVTNLLAILGGAGLTGGTLYYYRTKVPDLFMLTLALGSTMCVVTVFLGEFLIEEMDAELFGFFFLGFAVIAQVAFVTWWIRKEGKRMRLSLDENDVEVNQ